MTRQKLPGFAGAAKLGSKNADFLRERSRGLTIFSKIQQKKN